MIQRALVIDEESYGKEHTEVAKNLKNLGQVLQAMSRRAEAEPLMRRALTILLDFSHHAGFEHPSQKIFLANYRRLLQAMGKSPAEIEESIKTLK